jgi:hypothetical protein
MTVNPSYKSLGYLLRIYEGSSPREQRDILDAIRGVKGGEILADRLPKMSRNPAFLGKLGLKPSQRTDRGKIEPGVNLDRGEGQGPDRGEDNREPGLRK